MSIHQGVMLTNVQIYSKIIVKIYSKTSERQFTFSHLKQPVLIHWWSRYSGANIIQSVFFMLPAWPTGI